MGELLPGPGDIEVFVQLGPFSDIPTLGSSDPDVLHQLSSLVDGHRTSPAEDAEEQVDEDGEEDSSTEQFGEAVRRNRF